MLIIVFLSSLLITTINDLPGRHDFDIGDPCLTSLVFATIHDPLGCDLHVDHRFYFPLFSL
jgi:hypothetical protein